ncbi:hypothetical protein M3Y99_00964600 [Aphelenchoides fujianensis]|nr:hypothetical protein M3Y99_00964600 [Aphelenchoides fujianensis]
MQSETDGSESGWSLVDGEERPGSSSFPLPLAHFRSLQIDSDDFSVSDSEAAVHPLAAVESEWSASEREDEDGIERVHSEAEEEVVVEEDEEDLATDVDEIESIVDLNEEAEEIAVQTERNVQNEDDLRDRAEDIFHFAVDLRNERRVQIFAIGSVVAALLMALSSAGRSASTISNRIKSDINSRQMSRRPLRPLCRVPPERRRPLRSRASPTVTPSLLPDDRPDPQMCSKEPSFFNLTRSLFKQVVNFANTTALTAIAESRTDLVRLSSWLHKKTMKTLPKVVEQLGNVRSNWRLKFRSYLKKVGNALAAPLARHDAQLHERDAEGLREHQTGPRSPPSTRSRTTAGVNRSSRKSAGTSGLCDHSSPFADHLDNSSIFRERLGKKQADSYVAYLRHLPPRQCTLNSTLMSCERCWWTGNCADVKKKCSPLRRWQRQKKIDPAAFLAGDEAARQILNKLGWITNLQKPCAPHSEPIGPPRSRKEERKAEKAKRRAQPQAPKKKEEDWLLQRGEKREQRRRAESASSWLFERHAHRRYLRQRGPLSNWLFARSSRRAALRNGGK